MDQWFHSELGGVHRAEEMVLTISRQMNDSAPSTYLLSRGVTSFPPKDPSPASITAHCLPSK
jgi:hypothetical protein